MTSTPCFAVGQRIQRNNSSNKRNNAKHREGVVLSREFKPLNKFRPGVNEYWHYEIRWDDRTQSDTVLQQRLLPINE